MNPTSDQPITARRREQLHRLRAEHHPDCSVCGRNTGQRQVHGHPVSQATGPYHQVKQWTRFYSPDYSY